MASTKQRDVIKCILKENKRLAGADVDRVLLVKALLRRLDDLVDLDFICDVSGRWRRTKQKWIVNALNDQEGEGDDKYKLSSGQQTNAREHQQRRGRTYTRPKSSESAIQKKPCF